MTEGASRLPTDAAPADMTWHFLPGPASFLGARCLDAVMGALPWGLAAELCVTAGGLMTNAYFARLGGADLSKDGRGICYVDGQATFGMSKAQTLGWDSGL